MSKNAMRESLLQQNATASVEAEIERMHGLMDAENRRARRLTTWTIVVWSAWFAAVVLMFVVYLLVPAFMAKPAAAAPPAAPAAPAAQQEGFAGTFVTVIVMTAALVTLVSVVLLPVAGVILLILQILARRSASLSQVRISVAAIDAQLKLLAAAHPSQPTGPEH